MHDRSGANPAQLELCLRIGSQKPAVLRFEDALRPDAAGVVDRLKARGFQVEMLSGDRLETVAHVAGQLGIENFRAQWSPQAKASSHLGAARGRQEGARGRRRTERCPGTRGRPCLDCALQRIRRRPHGRRLRVPRRCAPPRADRSRCLPALAPAWCCRTSASPPATTPSPFHWRSWALQPRWSPRSPCRRRLLWSPAMP